MNYLLNMPRHEYTYPLPSVHVNTHLRRERQVIIPEVVAVPEFHLSAVDVASPTMPHHSGSHWTLQNFCSVTAEMTGAREMLALVPDVWPIQRRSNRIPERTQTANWPM